MKTAVLGCGAIGGLFLGYLSQKGCDVTGVVKDYQKESLLNEGLIIENQKENVKIKVKADTKLNEKTDLTIFAVKIDDLREAIENNIDNLKGTIVLSAQNGVKADYILSKYFPKNKIITGIVMFGATFYPPNKVVDNFSGELALGGIFGDKPDDLDKVNDFLSPVFNTAVLDNMKGAKYLKLLINLNNCIPAVLGASMQETFLDIDCARLAIKLNREAYAIIKGSGITLADLPSYPKKRIEGMALMDLDEAAGLFSKIMTSLSKEPLYGSILQSIKRSKFSEIDYINGEFVELAKENSLGAPLNKKIIELVHGVEKTGKFLTKRELIERFR